MGRLNFCKVISFKHCIEWVFSCIFPPNKIVGITTPLLGLTFFVWSGPPLIFDLYVFACSLHTNCAMTRYIEVRPLQPQSFNRWKTAKFETELPNLSRNNVLVSKPVWIISWGVDKKGSAYKRVKWEWPQSNADKNLSNINASYEEGRSGDIRSVKNEPELMEIYSMVGFKMSLLLLS